MLALQPDRGAGRTPGRFRFFGGPCSFTFAPDAALVADYERGALRGVRGALEALEARMMTAVRGGPAAHARLEQAVTNALPQAVFLLVPAYALLVAVAYRGAGRLYPGHLFVALHLHAFAFLALAGLFAVRAAAFRLAAAVDRTGVTIALNALVTVAATPALLVLVVLRS